MSVQLASQSDKMRSGAEAAAQELRTELATLQSARTDVDKRRKNAESQLIELQTRLQELQGDKQHTEEQYTRLQVYPLGDSLCLHTSIRI